jgi:hypothetical protein
VGDGEVIEVAWNAILLCVLCVSVRKREEFSHRDTEATEIRLENAFRSGPVDLAGRLAADPLGEGEVIEVVWNAILLCVLCVSARKERILSQRHRDRRDKTGKRFLDPALLTCAGRLAADPLGEGEVIEVVWNAILLCVLCVSARKERILSQRRRDKTGKRFSIRPCQVISDSSIEL